MIGLRNPTATVVESGDRLRAVVGALAVAALVTLSVVLLGGLVLVPDAVFAGLVVPAWALVFLGTAALALCCWLGYARLRDHWPALVERWFGLAALVRGVVAGAAPALLLTLAAVTVAGRRTFAVALLTLLVGWPVAAVLSWRAVRRSAEGVWLRRLGVATAGSLALACVVALAHLAGGPLGADAPPLVLLCCYPAAVAVAYLRTGGDSLRAVSTTTGYAQLERLEVVTVAVVAGILVGCCVATVAVALDGSLAQTALTYVFVWLLATALVLVHLVRKRRESERGDLIVVERSEYPPVRELTVENHGHVAVDLSGAKLRDAAGDRYALGIDRTVGPGGRFTVDLPPEFELEPTDPQVALPLDWTLQGRDTTAAIYTRGGTSYSLGDPGAGTAD